MMGTVDGAPNKIVTNVSVRMSYDFTKIMRILLQEAMDGNFATKGQAVARRDQLVYEDPAEPVEESAPTPAAQPDPAAPAFSPCFTDSVVPNDEVVDSSPPTEIDPDTAVSSGDPADPDRYPDRQPLPESY